MDAFEDGGESWKKMVVVGERERTIGGGGWVGLIARNDY